jgi:3-deoxy-D-manno-octulosonate 8-phosphate phosphatase (KDO 8-P phosphatase)
MRILKRYGVEPRDAAFVGDDLPDVSLLRLLGLPVAVGNAVPEVRAICTHQVAKTGGNGAVREFVEDFLKARGEWDIAWNRYVDARSRPKVEAPV